MPVTPYQPIGTPQKHVSHDRMLEILAKRSPHAAQSATPKEAQSECPAAPKDSAPASLQWGNPIVTSPGSAHMYSVCRRYRIDKIVSQTIVQYTVWRLCTVRGELNKRLGAVGEAAVAQALAQADADAKAAT